ncbi:hypothetical protein [Gordonia sp. VNK21]|uniref:hypothetical protein n=1 Tax=Gordonia sp. VNK21 TaxID=3382483 RepID=UPI0038D35986
MYVNTGEPAGLVVEVDDGQVLGTPFSISHAPGAVKLEPASNPPHASLITSVPVYAHVDAGETVTVTFEFIDTNAQNLGRIDVGYRAAAPQTVYIHPGEPIMVTVYNEKIGYVEPRNPAGRTPLQSIPSGPVWRP